MEEIGFILVEYYLEHYYIRVLYVQSQRTLMFLLYLNYVTIPQNVDPFLDPQLIFH